MSIRAIWYHLLQTYRSELIWAPNGRKTPSWVYFPYLFGVACLFVSSYITVSKAGTAVAGRAAEFAQLMGYLFVVICVTNLQGYFRRMLHEGPTPFLRLHGVTLTQITALRFYESLINVGYLGAFPLMPVLAYLLVWKGLSVQTFIGVALFAGTLVLAAAVAMTAVCWLLAVGQIRLIRVLSAVLLSGGMGLLFVGVYAGLFADFSSLPVVSAMPAWAPWTWVAGVVDSEEIVVTLGAGTGLLVLMLAAAGAFVRMAGLGYARYVPVFAPPGRKYGSSAATTVARLFPAAVRHHVWKDLLVLVRDRRKLVPLIISVLFVFVMLLPSLLGRSFRSQPGTDLVFLAFVFSAIQTSMANTLVGLPSLSHDGPLLVWLKQHPSELRGYVLGKNALLLLITLPLTVLFSGAASSQLHVPTGLALLVSTMTSVLLAPATVAVSLVFCSSAQPERQDALVHPLALIVLVVVQGLFMYAGSIVILAAGNLTPGHSALLGAILTGMWILLVAVLTRLGLKRLREADLHF